MPALDTNLREWCQCHRSEGQTQHVGRQSQSPQTRGQSEILGKLLAGRGETRGSPAYGQVDEQDGSDHEPLLPSRPVSWVSWVAMREVHKGGSVPLAMAMQTVDTSAIILPLAFRRQQGLMC